VQKYILKTKQNPYLGGIGMSEETIVINIPPVEEWTLRNLKSVCRHNKKKGLYKNGTRDQLVQCVKGILRQRGMRDED
jgi:hypothetical protein